ncbi:hypothetical protein [Leuconostoc mesenteroides]|uniref:hypothetical protein n=1 Tax=Leuconostoc mesenteroides TaxID=1245 RepID=UPI000A04E4E0|nr:hypothetical protein [Leuconostoc mesenteroides]ORI39041.1 hypothetical protein BMR90_03285 [Leuconostoc mesenteroides subsp. cremoris]ORI39720.1 hypothetical protein BMR89_02455 [Leuconostoc mesenteroides subsp. cremoris]ORI41941.1 hypothetical protein BMR91_02900 [Leuconostoc mesenteroides subsp. cremoris]ORI43373.1 hypothetical protein BMR92_02630 [Leuconostoc mesenteroides subsp. cremoris]
MLSEIFIWKPRIQGSVFITHLYEHLLYRYIQSELKRNEFDKEGIIVNSETFMDGTFTELFFIDRKLFSGLIDIIKAFPSQVSKQELIMAIKSEVPRIVDELSNEDSTEEDFAVYSGLEVLGYDFRDMFRVMNEDDTIEDLYAKITMAGSSEIYSLFDSKANYISSNFVTTRLPEVFIFSYGKKEDFEYFNLSVTAQSIRQYFIYRLVSFILGQVDESILNREILDSQNIYLGYTFPVVTNQELNILGVVNGNKLIPVETILTEMNELNISIEKFTQLKNSFLTYLLVNVPQKDLFSDLVKAGLIRDLVNLNDMVDVVEHITLTEVNCFFENITKGSKLYDK